MNKKTAVVLLNLGGPDSKNAIRPFLLNFFMDRNIIDLPVPFRCILAWLIARKRSKREAGESYGELGDKSPLLENTQAQAQALEDHLNGVISNAGLAAEKSQAVDGDSSSPSASRNDSNIKFKTFVCMRYWHPMSPQVVRAVRDWGADEIVLLPLYPQFSTATTWSSLGVWNKAMHEAGYECPTSTICCYPFNEGFITASAENIKIQIEKAKKDGHKNPRILFSAHGLPEKTIKGGDPYQWQCEQTAEAIVKYLSGVISNAGLAAEKSQEVDGDSSSPSASRNDNEEIDWAICYQSRVGPLKWIGPSLDEELERAAADKVPVIIYPHAFTQEHVETLVELDIEYKEEAEHMGVEGYYRAETVSTHPAFIEGLAALVHKHLGKNEIQAEGHQSLCPVEFNRCCMRKE